MDGGTDDAKTILDSKRNAYFAYLVQCLNWGLNTDLIICKVSLMY